MMPVIGKDMISDLPESVLCYILSFLRTKEAVRTSILATKWRYLWTHLSVYNFERCSVSKPDHKPADCLIDLVNELFHKSNRLEIERLCITLQGNIVDAGKVSSLLSSALMHQVHDLQLYLEPRNSKTLYMSHLTFTNEKSAQRLLSGCPVLQELTLNKCYWVNIKHISVSISTLRKLTVHFKSSCLDRNSCTVKIDAVNLLSLSYTSNPTINCFLVNSTSIVDAYIDLGFFYAQSQLLNVSVSVFAFELLSLLRSVEYLRLSDETIQCLNYAKPVLHLLPSFNNLTHLEVVLGYPSCEVLAVILHKSPKLEVLHIYKGFYLSLDGEDWTSDSLPCCFKSSLKLCAISDFCGDEAEIQLVKFLLENVTVLREMNIFCTGYLSENLEKLADVRNQLQPLGMGSFVINLCH